MNKLFTKIISSLVIVFSLLGLYASFVLTIEKINILKVGEHQLPCDINSVISCSNVMKTPQAEVFGFPNTLIGIAGYTFMLTIGIVIFLGNKLNRLVLLVANIGGLIAFLFSYWLLYESVYDIGFLCIYCILSCISATNIFLCLSLYNLRENVFQLKERTNNFIQKLMDRQYYFYFIGAWYFVIFTLIFVKYKDAFIQ